MKTLTNRTIYNPVQRDTVTFLKIAADTNGEFTLVDVELAPGGALASIIIKPTRKPSVVCREN